METLCDVCDVSSVLSSGVDSVMLRQSSVLLTRCVQKLYCLAPRTPHTLGEHLLCHRLRPLHPHTPSRGAKSQRKWSQEEEWRGRNKTALTYIAAAGVGMIGLSYAAVPLYRLYCQVRENPLL